MRFIDCTPVVTESGHIISVRVYDVVVELNVNSLLYGYVETKEPRVS